MPCTKCNCCKKASENIRSYSLHTGRLKVRDNSVHVLFTVWWEKHKLRYYIYTETGTNTEADWKSVNQTGPTDNLPSSSGAPGLAFSSNTKRRRSKRGEKERKRKQGIDVKHAAHNHTDKMKRR